MSGILTAQEIRAAIAEGTLVLNALDQQVQACSYDMRIGTVFREGQIIRAGHPEAGKQIIVRPGDVISLFTLEELELGADVAATAYPINSQSSRGLLVLNPGHVDPGFKGPLTVKALNLRKVDIALSFDAPIFTVVFERLAAATQQPYETDKTRPEREREFNEKDVETGARRITDLIDVRALVSEQYLTQREVAELIRDHWISKVAFLASMVALIATIVGSGFAIASFFQDRAGAPDSAPVVQQATGTNTTASAPAVTPQLSPAPQAVDTGNSD